MTVTITPSVGDIENNIVPLDLLVTDEDRSTAMAINGTPVANAQNTGATPPPPDSNIIKSGNGSVVKGFLKSHNYSPGDSGWIIKGNGDVEFSDGVFRGDISAATGTIGGWTIGATFIGDNAVANDATVLLDSTNTLIRLGATSGDYITLDGANVRLRSSNYVTGVSGFTIEPDLIEAQNIRARGVLQSAVFQKDNVSAVGGQLLIANADALDADMTALDASTLTIKGDTTFSVNDILRIKDGTDDEWLRVTNVGSAPTYTVTRDLGSAYTADNNPAWTTGQAVVKQGESDGSATYSGGWLQLLGEGTNSPYYSVFNRTGVAYNAYSEVVRIGNLNGIAGITSDKFGIFAGDSVQSLLWDGTDLSFSGRAPRSLMYWSQLLSIAEWSGAGDNGHAILAVATTDGAQIANGGASNSVNVSKKTSFTGQTIFGNGKTVSMKFWLRGEDRGTGNRNFYFVVGSLSESEPTTNTTHHFGFKVIYTTGALTSINATSGDGTTQELTAISSPSNTGSFYEATYDGTNVKFYKNGVLGATHSTNVPGVAQTGNLFTIIAERNTGAESSHPRMFLHNIQYEFES